VQAAVGGEGGRGPEVCRLYGFAYEMGFADPGPLGVREDDGDGVAGGLERGDEGVDVGGGLVAGWAVVVCYLCVCVSMW
jgi:hypothetical protein